MTVAGNTVYLYDSSGKELAQLPGDKVAFLPRSEKFVAFLFGKNRQTLDISGGQSRLFDGSGLELAVLKGDFDLTDIVMYGAGNLPPSLEEMYSKSLSFFSPDGQRLVTSDAKNSYLYNASGQQIAKLPGLSPKFSSTGQYFTVASEGRVYVFDRSGKRLIETQGEFGVFSPDGRYIAIVARR